LRGQRKEREIAGALLNGVTLAATTVSNRVLLERFGLVAEEDFAAILGVSVKTLKNRRREELPDFVKAGRRRLFVEESVRDFLDARRVRGRG
jgi:hypothetical protein